MTAVGGDSGDSTWHPNPERRRSLHVLCADDDPSVGKTLKVLLARAGHRVEVAADGQAAFELFAADLAGFDLVITDHQMPLLDGRGLVTKLRAASFPGKIFVHSSTLSAADTAAYRELTVDQFFVKPGQSVALLIAVGQVSRS